MVSTWKKKQHKYVKRKGKGDYYNPMCALGDEKSFLKTSSRNEL